MLYVAVASFGILVAAAALALRLPRRGIIFFLVGTAIGAWSMVLTTIGFAGLVLRDLSPLVLLVVALLWPAAAAAVFVLRPPGSLRVRERLRASTRTMRAAVAWPPAAIALLLIVGTLLWRVFLALRLPMTDYDGWSYHLVTVDVWLQANQLVRVPQRIWSDGFPSNGEVLTTWLMAFDRRDALAGFTSILPTPLAIVAVAGLARRFGVSRRTALLCCLLFGATPALVALAGTSYVDAAMAAAVLATWYLGLRFLAGERDGPTTLLFALAAGIAAGTKFTGFLLVGPMLVAAGLVLLAAFIRAWRTGTAIRPYIGRLTLLIGPVIVFAGMWYLKNVFIHGNPLYPVALGPLPGPTTLAGMTIDVAALDRLHPLLRVPASWAADWGITRYVYNVRPGGFGRAWLLIIPFAVAGLLLLVRDRRWLPIGLIVVPAAVTLATMPENWYARVTLFVPGIALPLAALALDALRPRPRLVAASALLVLAAASLTLTNIRPNTDIRGPGGGVGKASPRQYLAFLLSSDEERLAIGLLRDCAGFRQIPPGARVVPGGFNLLHGVVGPDLDRVLTAPLAPVTDVNALVAQMHDRDARWLVTREGSALSELAATVPDRLSSRGDTCRDARLWELTD